MFEIRGTKKGDPLSSLLFSTVLQMAMKDDVDRWQRTTRMGKPLGNQESDCLTNLRFADDVLLFSTSLVQLQKMMCDFKKNTENVGLKIHPEMEINNIKVEILSACGSAKYLRRTITFQQQETAEIKNRIRAALASFHKMQTRADVKIVLFAAQTPPIQYGDHADAELCLWNLDIIKGTRKNDTIDSTENASSSRQRENTKRKRRPASTRKMEKRKKQTTETQMMKLLRVAVQTQIATKTVTSSS